MRWVRQGLQAPAAVMAVVLLVWLIQDFTVRVAYPFDIEWMEGGMLVHAWRLRQGLA